MSDEYQPKHRWRRTTPDHPGTEQDFHAHDDTGQYVGRIYQTYHHPIKNKWKWNGSTPFAFKGVSPSPNAGFVLTAREAARKVEEYWDLCIDTMTDRWGRADEQ